MYYYICQVREIMWAQEEPMSDERAEIEHETLELSKAQYEKAIETGKHVIELPGLEHYTDEYLNSLCDMTEPVIYDNETKH